MGKEQVFFSFADSLNWDQAHPYDEGSWDHFWQRDAQQFLLTSFCPKMIKPYNFCPLAPRMSSKNGEKLFR